ncbi:hypothetical protein [Pseudomonas sp. HY7a-MNA-CIBAN-0227]|uniref:hypothetical protein n=1 Tax=Pseudomonas sp. HY7a-MNA-CIBAN-0227 TaxID=3140474 RepID=UPI00332C6F05
MNTATNAADNTNVEENENAVSSNTELNIVKGVLESENPSINDFVDLAKQGFYDTNFVNLLQDFTDNVAKKMEPKDYDAEIGALQSELLATKDLTKRFGIMEAITNLMNQQAGEGSEIRTKLEGVSFVEIAVAYAKDIQALVDGVAIEFLKKGQTATLKFKRAPKDGSIATTTTSAPAETITFEIKGVAHTVKAGKGRLNSEILAIAEDHAKAVKDENAKTKPVFIQALKDGKVKGAKVTKVETV